MRVSPIDIAPVATIMEKQIPSSTVARFDRMIREAEGFDWEWLESTLDRYPVISKCRLSDGRLPLRALLEWKTPGPFHLLNEHGADHDLVSAAAATQADEVKQQLAADATQLNKTDSTGNTPLHWACISGYAVNSGDRRPEVVKLLLEAGADPELKNDYGETPLDCALLSGGANAIETLLEYDVEFSIQFAVAEENLELLDEFLDADPNLISWSSPRDGSTLLHLAVWHECGAGVINYLVKRGAEHVLDACDNLGTSALLLAMRTDAFDEAEALISAGADPNIVMDRPRSDSPLDLAIRKDRVQLTDLLLAHDARTNRLEFGKPWCLVDSGEIVEVLIKYGFDPMVPDEKGKTLLDHAVEEGKKDVVTSLLEHGGEPTFHAFIVVGDLVKVESMINLKPELLYPTVSPEEVEDVPDGHVEMVWGSCNGTALHYAVKSGSSAMVKLLIECGAPVNAVDQAGWTPLHDAVYYTIENDFIEGKVIISALLTAGADPEMQTAGGRAPVDVADYFLRFSDDYSEVAIQVTKYINQT